MKLLELFSQTWQSSLQGHRRRHYYNCFHMLRSISSSLILMCKIGWFSPLTHTHTPLPVFSWLTLVCVNSLLNPSMSIAVALCSYLNSSTAVIDLVEQTTVTGFPYLWHMWSRKLKYMSDFNLVNKKKKKKTWTRKGEIGSCCKLYAEQNFNQMSKPSGSTSNWTEGIWVC